MRDEIISIIGAGRVGRTLAREFHKKDKKIATVIDIDSKKADLCQAQCHAGESSADAGRVSPETSVLIIAVPDDQIGTVAGDLAKQWQPAPGTVVAHTSGLLSSDILSPLASPDRFLNSIHPCYSFMEDGELMPDVYFALEGQDQGIQRLESLVRILEGKPFRIQSEDKPLYHAACAIASNYLVSLYTYSEDVMDSLKTGQKDCLLPLIQSTVANIRQRGSGALTGPIVRGDTGAVEKHLISLREKNPQWIAPYVILGKWALKVAGPMNTDKDNLNQIKFLFNQFKKTDEKTTG